MEQQQEKKRAAKLRRVDLRRLWHWLRNCTPSEGTFNCLRRAHLELSAILKPKPDDKGVLQLDDSVPMEQEYACEFGERALSGLRTAIAQAISGESNPDRKPAPFGSIIEIILPLAESLGLLEQLSYECSVLSNVRDVE